jgi:hypothetical protein
MAKILNKNIYPIDTKISDTDMVIGSDGDKQFKTKNFSVGALKSHILDGGGGDGGGGYGNDDGTFTWVMYAEDIDGTNMSPMKLSSSNFIGYGFNKIDKTPSLDPLEYIWMPITLVKGRDGIDGSNGIEGLDGKTGIQGPNGIGGNPTYFHIAYADDINGGGFNQHPYDKKFIGTYSDYTLADSDIPSDYTWMAVTGLDGTKGIPGVNAIDGLTYYLHIAYADSEDGVTGFDIVESEDKQFIGTLVDLVENDSLIPSDYTWARILNPEIGIPDGNGTFTWEKYTINPDGNYPLYDTDEGMLYRGFAFKKTTPIESEIASDYQWHLIYINNAYNQNNRIRVIDISTSYFDTKAVTEQSISEWVNANGISVDETENIIFNIGDTAIIDEPVVAPSLNPNISLPLVLLGTTATTASLTWVNLDTAIIRYELFYNALFDDLGDLNVTSKTLTGLSAIAYSCYVIGYDTYGTSKKSNTVTFSLYVASTPNISVGTNTGDVTDTSIRVNWNIQASFGATRYELYRNGVKVYDGALTTFNSTALTQSTSYAFYVIAYNGATASLQSATLNVSTIATITPTLTAPTIAFISAKDESIKFSIVVPSSEIGRITAIRIEYKGINAINWNEAPAIAYANTAILFNLFSDINYQIRVRSTDGTILSPYSNVIEQLTLTSKKAKISLSLMSELSSQDVTDGYINPLNIWDGKPNSAIKVYVNALITYLGNRTGGAIIFKNSLFQVNSGYPQTLTFNLDNSGNFGGLFEIQSPKEGALVTITVTITESLNGLDQIAYTDTMSYTPPPLN